jgi:hypothetical protein
VDEAWVGLAEAIGQLRRELSAALTAAEGERLRFQLGPIELDFTVDWRRTGGADAGVRWGVVSFGAKGEIAATSGHRVKLVLTPKDSVTGGDVEVVSRRSGTPPGE